MIELDGRYFILATVHMNLKYINTVLAGKVLCWKLYHQVMGTESIYTIEDLVSGKRITAHIHNLRPFMYDPDHTSPRTVANTMSKSLSLNLICTSR